MRDHMHNFGAVSAIVPATLSDDPAPIAVDRSGFEALTFALLFGVGGITFTSANRIDFIMEHSDDGAAWAPVDPSNVIGGTPDAAGIVLSQRSAHPAASVHRYGYVDGVVGQRRFVRLRADFAGTHGTGTALAALAILGDPRNLPVA